MNDEMIICPFCGKSILDNAVKCGHCHKNFSHDYKDNLNPFVNERIRELVEKHQLDVSPLDKNLISFLHDIPIMLEKGLIDRSDIHMSYDNKQIILDHVNIFLTWKEYREIIGCPIPLYLTYQKFSRRFREMGASSVLDNNKRCFAFSCVVIRDDLFNKIKKSISIYKGKTNSNTYIEPRMSKLLNLKTKPGKAYSPTLPKKIVQTNQSLSKKSAEFFREVPELPNKILIAEEFNNNTINLDELIEEHDA